MSAFIHSPSRPYGTISQWRTLPLFYLTPSKRNHISVENSTIISSHPVHTEPYLSGELYHYSISPRPYGTISQRRTLPLFYLTPSIRNRISAENSTIILSHPVHTEPYLSEELYHYSLPSRPYGTGSHWRTLPLFYHTLSIRNHISVEKVLF